MALDAAVARPPQAPVVAAATVALEENRRPNTRSTYSKCWRLWRVNAAPPPCGSEADGAGQEWCARRGWEDGELVWESKAILFLTDVVLPIRQVRPQKLPRPEAGARKRKMAAARQATRRCRLRQAQAQAENDAGARAVEETSLSI
jgi:hypothetical protein